MRFGTCRGVMLAILSALAAMSMSGSVRANGLDFHKAIPREVEAIDVNTGGPYYAPPIPYGHYAKDGLLGKGFGLIHGMTGKLHGLGGLGGLCLGCGGKGCGHCGGTGLFAGHDGGHGHGGDNGCNEPGCGMGRGLGIGGGGLGWGRGKRIKDCGLCGNTGCGICTSTILPSAQVGPAAPSAQGHAVTTDNCGVQGCKLGLGHKHGGRSLGNGCNHGSGVSCGNCGISGLNGGRAFGLGRGCGHGEGDVCDNCAGGGHGRGRGTGCSNCGGGGCGLCSKVGSALGHGKGFLYGLTHPHAGKIKYFVGPGGPVPITPGYVPYVVTTRSPRDFLAFPPFTP